jgi:hypothetical protein
LQVLPGEVQRAPDGRQRAADLAARPGHAIGDWPDRKGRAAASTLSALIGAKQDNQAEEGEVAGQSADHAAISAAARLCAPDHHPS